MPDIYYPRYYPYRHQSGHSLGRRADTSQQIIGICRHGT